MNVRALIFARRLHAKNAAVKPCLWKLERAEKSLAIVVFDSSHILLFEIAEAL